MTRNALLRPRQAARLARVSFPTFERLVALGEGPTVHHAPRGVALFREVDVLYWRKQRILRRTTARHDGRRRREEARREAEELGFRSSVEGVTWHARWDCWTARLSWSGAERWIGRFDRHDDAALEARRARALKARGVSWEQFRRGDFEDLPLEVGRGVGELAHADASVIKPPERRRRE